MLVIRADQQTAFEQVARIRFEDEMMAHSKDFSPRLCEVIGDEQLRLALRSAITRAEAYGFTNRGPIRLFIELMFLCGSSFDTDPQYMIIGRLLRDPADQMMRAEDIHEEHNRYLAEVSGPEAINVRNALRELALFVRQPLSFSLRNLAAGLHSEIRRLFPEKYLYASEAGISRLIEEGKSASSLHDFFEARQITLIVVLMFAFGHGCTNDPLYPWISSTLEDERIVSLAGRAERLERKAVTWLTHVLARDERGVEA